MEDYSYEKELRKQFLIAINDETVLMKLDDETRAEFRQLRYRMRKGTVGESTMRKVVEKYLHKRIIIVDK
ncbi:hypothetical protein [Fulvivirga sedimenti]|uniref:Uncharacterized protein n=1 Tax=Fulvivirga sedimenti TaxID=2879465 RepID=A0A9X1HVS4_9BACT|nr:hypothetical protein [Fulvivirga sedimenti]MCA6077948.1 hypothetical protein [Fulvivirga sedimenti]